MIIDLRSDTVTRPTQEMLEAMQAAPLGDDVYGDDPTVNALEALAAEVTGKEAALFVCSGTMGNQLAIMSHTHIGEEIIAHVNSHIIQHEAGAYARLSGVSAMTVNHQRGAITPEDVEAACRTPDLHHPVTTLLCMQNTKSNGTVISLEQNKLTTAKAHELGLKIHMDGARIFNAATALGVPVRQLVEDMDSVMFCLSKGLCAPVGSMLCGSREFIDRARRNRKVLGGGMRQAGVLAACGIIAIEKMSKRLKEDHEKATHLASALSVLPGVSLDPMLVQTNMVWMEVTKPGFEDGDFVNYLKERGVLINGDARHRYRFVTHHDVSEEQMETAVHHINNYMHRD